MSAFHQLEIAVQGAAAENTALRTHNEAVRVATVELYSLLIGHDDDDAKRPHRCLFCDKPYGRLQPGPNDIYTCVTAKCGHKGMGQDCFNFPSEPSPNIKGKSCGLAYGKSEHVVDCYACRHK